MGYAALTGTIATAFSSFQVVAIDANAVAQMKKSEADYQNGVIGQKGSDPDADHTSEENEINAAERGTLKDASKAAGDCAKAIYSLK